jgi:WD40 repeat protein
MATKWEKVHVFISSTFKDMHAERDYLVKRVFPQLNEWCEQRRLRLVDIDLRWGVTEQDAQNRNVVKVCLDKIDACRPFFLCFLGQRRGWVPKYSSNGADENNDIPLSTIGEFPNLGKYAGITSVTELEIVHALVDPLHRGRQRDPERPGEYYEPAEYAFFYLRDDSYLEQIASPELRKIYTNDSAEDDQELNKWRNEKIPATGRPKRAYTARWDPDLNTPELGLPGRLTDFQHQSSSLDNIILEDLKAAISARYPHHVGNEELTDLQKEIDQQELFLFSGSEGFISRGDDFKELNDYVNSSSDRLFVLTAPGGMGKSTLLAKWIENCKEGGSSKTQGETIHYRFIGKSDRSTTVYSLLHFLARELKEMAGKISSEIPVEPQKLRQEFPKLLEAAGKKGKTVIILDALNQLESGLSDLAWLPYQLPANIKLIISFKSDDPEAENILQQIQGQVVHSRVLPFDNMEDRRKLVNEYLRQYLKALDENHLKTLVQTSGAESPLFLKVILSELRVFGDFGSLQEKISSDFGETPITAFQGVLKRLENDPAHSPIDPKQAVPLIFGLLAHSRQGLSVDELTSIMLQVFTDGGNIFDKQDVRDAVQLYFRQMRPFLAYRDGCYDFFYESFRLAAQEFFMGDVFPRRADKDWHRLLAKYFAQQPYRKIDANGKETPDLHKLIEQPHQQVHGELWEDVINTLTDFDFIEGKCRNLSCYLLELDYQLALATWPANVIGKNILFAFEERIRLESQKIQKNPDITFSCLYNYLTWVDSPDGPIHRMCEQQRTGRTNWLRSVQNPQSSPVYIPKGHTGPVKRVAITPDGKYILSGSDDKTLLLWDLKTQRVVRAFLGHLEKVNTIGISQDGKTALSGSGDGNLKLWGINSGRLLRDIKTGAGVSHCAISPNGQQGVSCSYSGLMLWDLQTGLLIHGFERIVAKNSTRVAITPDGANVLVGFKNGKILLLDIKSGQILRTFEGHNGGITSLGISLDGKFAISGSGDHTVKYWELKSGQMMHSFESHQYHVPAVAIAPDGNFAISGSLDGIKQWDLNNGELLNSFQDNSRPGAEPIGWVDGLGYTADGQIAVSANSNHTLKLWDPQTGHVIKTLGYPPKHTGEFAFAPDGKKMLSSSHFDDALILWDIKKCEVIHCLEGHTEHVLHLAIDSDSNTAISASGSRFLSQVCTVKLWDLQGGHLLHSYQAQDSVDSVAISSSGIAAFSDGKLLKIFNVKSGNLLWVLEGHTGVITSIAFTRAGGKVLSGSLDRTLKLWDMKTGQLLKTQQTPDDAISFLTLASDDNTVLSSAWVANLKLWDLNGGQLLHTLEGHKGEIKAIAISADGMIAASASNDRSIKLWDIQTGKHLHSIDNQTGQILALNFSPEAGEIIAGSFSSEGAILNTFDTKTGEHLGTLILNEQQQTFQDNSLSGHREASKVSCLFSPDEKTIYSYLDLKISFSLPNSSDVRRRNYAIKCWDRETGALQHIFQAHTESVMKVLVTPDGKTMISGSRNDKFINVWDVLSDRLTHSIPAEGLIELALAPNGKTILSSHDHFDRQDNKHEYMLQHWNLETGKLIGSITGLTQRINILTFLGDNNQVISRSQDGDILLWDIQSASRKYSFQEHLIQSNSLMDNGDSVFISSDERKFYCKTQNGLQIWSLETGQLLQTIGKFIYADNSRVFYIPDGNLVLEQRQQELFLWEIQTGRLVRYYDTQGEWGLIKAASPDGSLVISITDDDQVNLWDLNTGKLLSRCQHPSINSTNRFHAEFVIIPDKEHAISNSNCINLWNFFNGQKIDLYKTLNENKEYVESLAISPDGKKAVVVHKTESVIGRGSSKFALWDVHTGQLLLTFKGKPERITSTVISPDGTKVASGTYSGSLRLWSLETGQEIQSFEGHKDLISSLAFAPNGETLFSASRDGKIKQWDIKNGKPIKLFESEKVFQINVSEDGKTLMSRTALHKFTFWDIATETIIQVIGESGFVGRLAISEKNNLFLAGFSVWDLKTGEKLHTLSPQLGGITSMVMTPDERKVIIATSDHSVTMWDLVTYESQMLFVNDSKITSIIVSSDTKWLACGDETGRIWIFEWAGSEYSLQQD